MIRERCHVGNKSNRESVAQNFLSGICLGGEKGPSSILQSSVSLPSSTAPTTGGGGGIGGTTGAPRNPSSWQQSRATGTTPCGAFGPQVGTGANVFGGAAGGNGFSGGASWGFGGFGGASAGCGGIEGGPFQGDTGAPSMMQSSVEGGGGGGGSDEVASNEDDEPPDKRRIEPPDPQSSLSPSLLTTIVPHKLQKSPRVSPNSGRKLQQMASPVEAKRPSQFLALFSPPSEAEISGNKENQFRHMSSCSESVLKPLMIDAASDFLCKMSTVGSGGKFDNKGGEMSDVSEEPTVIPELCSFVSQKSTNSESTDLTVSGSSSSGNNNQGIASHAIKGLFSPLSLAKTWGQNHSRILRTAMKRRTLSLDSSGGGSNLVGTPILINEIMPEDGSWPSGDYWEGQRISQRSVQLSGARMKAPLSMFSAIKYSRANNKACLEPATRPRGVKVLPLPTTSDKFVVCQLEEVVITEYEDKDACVSYAIFINAEPSVINANHPQPSTVSTFVYQYCLHPHMGTKKHPPQKSSSMNRADNERLSLDHSSDGFIQLGVSHECYPVPVYPKVTKPGQRATLVGHPPSLQSFPSHDSTNRGKISKTSLANLGGDAMINFQRQYSTVAPVSFVSVDFLPDQVKHLNQAYAPFVLDDPSLNHASKTSLKLPGYRFSLLPHEEQFTSKQHVNERFKDRFPYIQLTLTKLRSMKHQISCYLYQECQFDLSIACNAVIYFEKLVFAERVSKANRRYSAAVCAILAAKMGDVKGAQLSKLASGLSHLYKINKHDMLAFEFPVLVALKFNLLIAEDVMCDVYRNLSQTLT